LRRRLGWPQFDLRFARLTSSHEQADESHVGTSSQKTAFAVRLETPELAFAGAKRADEGFIESHSDPDALRNQLRRHLSEKRIEKANLTKAERNELANQAEVIFTKYGRRR
jgi:hypothetical protein